MKVYFHILFTFIWCTTICFERIECLNTDHELHTVKKQLNDSTPANLQLQTANGSSMANKISDNNDVHIVIGHPNEKYDIPNSVRVGFYIFIGLGLLAIFFIVFRTYRLRLSRAEKRYGVHGDRSAQELIPLPIAIEEDSDNDDQTIFEIKGQTRVS